MDKHGNRGENVIQAPASQTRGWRRRVSGALAVLVLLAATAIVLHGSQAAAGHPTASTPITSAPANANSKPGQNLCAPRLPWDTIRQQTALGLHLTVARVRVLVLEGKPIQVVAAARHISGGRLHTLELHALQVGNARWIRLGCNTRQEGDAYMRIYSHMTPAQLNQEFTSLFVES
ncbi:MAG TPA: hypothetical protein VNL71_21440 [Chloroflexota bacterium]|nr:hypothetical protein [Chloroflexota bacterium]